MGVVLADAGYGDETAFRDGITALGMRYAVGIRPGTTVWAPGTAPLPPKAWVGRGKKPTKLRREPGNEPVTVKALAMALPAQAWSTVTWHEGTNDELSGRFAALRVRPAHRDYLATKMRPQEWLLIEWPEGEAEPAKYFLTTAPEEATLAQMVFVTKMRWRIERDYQDLKQDLGLGHYEGRGWRGFHHHAPAVPEGYIPRGSPARATPRAKLDHDAAPATRSRTGTLPALQLDQAASIFMTQ